MGFFIPIWAVYLMLITIYVFYYIFIHSGKSGDLLVDD